MRNVSYPIRRTRRHDLTFIVVIQLDDWTYKPFSERLVLLFSDLQIINNFISYCSRGPRYPQKANYTKHGYSLSNERYLPMSTFKEHLLSTSVLFLSLVFYSSLSVFELSLYVACWFGFLIVTVLLPRQLLSFLLKSLLVICESAFWVILHTFYSLWLGRWFCGLFVFYFLVYFVKSVLIVNHSWFCTKSTVIFSISLTWY